MPEPALSAFVSDIAQIDWIRRVRSKLFRVFTGLEECAEQTGLPAARFIHRASFFKNSKIARLMVSLTDSCSRLAIFSSAFRSFCLTRKAMSFFGMLLAYNNQ